MTEEEEKSTITCAHCKKEFTPKDKRYSKFCSQHCAKEHRKEKMWRRKL